MAEAKVILITGASSGIGKSCYDWLRAQGYRVYGTSRKSKDYPGLLQMDVTDQDSIQQAMDEVLADAGRLDILINNAGISLVGSIEETSFEEAQKQVDTNFWGVVRTTKAVLPIMRQQGSGLIINISSLAGLFAIPFQAFYSASKFAMEGFTESLRMELRKSGIKACLIEPGDFHTEISKNRIFGHQAGNISDYHAGYNSAREIIIKGEEKGDDPTKIARLVSKIISTKNPKVRYPVGKPLDLLAGKLKKVLPQKVFEWLIADHYGL